MSNTHIGELRAFRCYDIGDVANKTDSLLADSNSVENAILVGWTKANKEFFIAKDGIAASILKHAIFYHDFATDGPASTGTVELRGTPIAVGSVILPAYLFVFTLYTTGSSQTLAVGTKKKTTGADISTTNILSATATGTVGTAGYHALNTSPVNLTTTTDSDITISFTVGTAAVTGGASMVLAPYFTPVVDTSAVSYR